MPNPTSSLLYDNQNLIREKWNAFVSLIPRQHWGWNIDPSFKCNWDQRNLPVGMYSPRSLWAIPFFQKNISNLKIHPFIFLSRHVFGSDDQDKVFGMVLELVDRDRVVQDGFRVKGDHDTRKPLRKVLSRSLEAKLYLERHIMATISISTKSSDLLITYGRRCLGQFRHSWFDLLLFFKKSNSQCLVSFYRTKEALLLRAVYTTRTLVGNFSPNGFFLGNFPLFIFISALQKQQWITNNPPRHAIVCARGVYSV
jgi:hypothetical protein